MRVTISLADVSIDLVIEESARNAVAPFVEVFLPGFLVSGKVAEAGFVVRSIGDPVSGHNVEYPCRLEDLGPEAVSNLRRVLGRHGVDPGEPVIVCRNGCLCLPRESRRASLILPAPESEGNRRAAFYRLFFVFLSQLMVRTGRLMLHGAGLRRGTQGHVFLGESGSGKSTAALSVSIGDVLSDDSPVISQTPSGFRIHPSPYSQVTVGEPKAPDFHAAGVRLGGMVFLNRDGTLGVVKRRWQEAFTELLTRHVHHFDFMERPDREKAFHLSYEISRAVPAFDLTWRKGDDFWPLIP